MIELGVNGVVREVEIARMGPGAKHGYAGFGETTFLYDGYCGVNGVSRQFLWGKILAKHVERIEVIIDYVYISELSEDREVDWASVMTVALTSDEDLNAVADYGSVSVNLEDRTINAVCTKAGYVLDVRGRVHIILKTGEVFNISPDATTDPGPIGLMDDMTFRGEYYMQINGNRGSYNVEYGDELKTGSFSGSASGVVTVTAPTAIAVIDVGSGICAGGSGSHITRMTMGEITIGGVAFLPEVKFGG